MHRFRRLRAPLREVLPQLSRKRRARLDGLSDREQPERPKEQRAATRLLTAELHTELQRLFDLAQARSK